MGVTDKMAIFLGQMDRLNARLDGTRGLVEDIGEAAERTAEQVSRQQVQQVTPFERRPGFIARAADGFRTLAQRALGGGTITTGDAVGGAVTTNDLLYDAPFQVGRDGPGNPITRGARTSWVYRDRVQVNPGFGATIYGQRDPFGDAARQTQQLAQANQTLGRIADAVEGNSNSATRAAR